MRTLNAPTDKQAVTPSLKMAVSPESLADHRQLYDKYMCKAQAPKLIAGLRYTWRACLYGSGQWRRRPFNEQLIRWYYGLHPPHPVG